MCPVGGSQAFKYNIKRGKYNEVLGDQHAKDSEFDKAANLYKQAYINIKKAENEDPNDTEVIELLNRIKLKYQDSNAKNTA